MKAIITGGGGDIAQAIANVLGSIGYEVYSPSRTQLDVVSENSVKEYMSAIKPDLLINCAGYIQPKTIIETQIDDFIKHFQVNVFGAMSCSKYAALSGCQTIINIGSTSAFEGKAEWGAYCASKAALVSLTETLAKEGIKCFGLHPSKTKTKMRKGLFPDENQEILMDPQDFALYILKILRDEFSNGSHIIVHKNYYYVLPQRSCPR